MKAKELLQKIRAIDALIEAKTAEVSALRDMMTKITPTLKEDSVSGGGFRDKICDGVARIADLEAEINRDVDRLVDAKAEIMAVLSRMTNADNISVLHKRYCLFKPWDQIAEEMGFSYRGVCYLHGRALVEFERVMNEVVKE